MNVRTPTLVRGKLKREKTPCLSRFSTTMLASLGSSSRCYPCSPPLLRLGKLILKLQVKCIFAVLTIPDGSPSYNPL